MLHRLLPIYKDIKQNLCHHLTRDFNEATAGTLDDENLTNFQQYHNILLVDRSNTKKD